MQHQLVRKLLYTTHFASISSIYRLLSTSLPTAEAVTQNPPTKSPFAAVEYLTKSCGLPMDKAINVSKYISHLKSPAKPDSILQFLREIGLTDADITRAVGPDPRLLCVNLEKKLKPRITQMQKIGFTPSQIAQLVSIYPSTLTSMSSSSFQRKIRFWMPFLGSLEGILSALKRAPYLLKVSLEKVVEPNISFLQKHCGIPPSQFKKMIMREPSFLTNNLNKLKEAAQRAQDLGLPRGSGLFVYALQMTFQLTPSKLDAKIKNLMDIGFSKKEIDSMIVKQPTLLTNSNERIHKSVGFLTSEAGLDLASISLHPMLFSLSLEKRIIPRHYILKSLKSKGLCENWSFPSVVGITEERFEGKFVRPYKDLIPEAIEAYEAARVGKV